jgi:phospholipid/cholesterol/gamma-HCH transport system substrate-binding protein
MYDYVKHIKWAKLKVGIVITLALVIIFVAIMFAGSIENIITPKVRIYAMVKDVKGLREGAPVWFSGVEIGSVNSINFTLTKNVEVEMVIAADALKYLKKDSRANILTLGLLGDKYVEITPGSNEAAPLNAEDIIRGETQTEIQDVVQTSQASIAKISDFINLLEEMLLKIEKGEGTVSKFIQDPSVYDNLRDVLEKLTLLVKKAEGGSGTLGRLLNEDSLYLDLSSSVEDIKLFARKLKESEGSLNRFIDDPSLYNRFLKASESLDTFTQRLASSRGTVRRLIEDESLYENLDAASERLNLLLEQIDKGQGLMGTLVKDEELSKELKTTLRELNMLIKDIKEHPSRYFKFSLF